MGMGDSNRRRHLLSLVAIVMVVGAFVAAPPAVADSIRLEASPSSPQGASKWALTVAGAVSEDTESKVYVYGVAGVEAPCSPVPPSGGAWGVLLEEPVFGSFEMNAEGVVPKPFSFTETELAYAPAESFCAYVVHEGATTASTGLIVHVTPSPAELEITEAQGVAVKDLSVRVASHYGASTRAPGYATLYVTTSPWAYVTVRLARFGHRTEHLEWGSNESAPASVVRFTCSRPGGSYRYEVTARSDVGSTLVRRGHFLAISAARCHAMERRETQERERNARSQAERLKEEARRERETLERWEHNCRALGGTPVTLYTNEGPERACRSPRGGLLPAPV